MSTSEQSTRVTPELQLSKSITDSESVNSLSPLPKDTTQQTGPSLSISILPSTQKSKTESVLSRQASQVASVTSPPPPTASVVSEPIRRLLPQSPTPTESSLSQQSSTKSEPNPPSSIKSSNNQTSKPSRQPTSLFNSLITKKANSTPSSQSKKSNSMTSSFDARKSSTDTEASEKDTFPRTFNRKPNQTEVKSSRSTTTSASESKRSTPVRTDKVVKKVEEKRTTTDSILKLASLFGKSSTPKNLSTFERIDCHTGKTTYLGRGTSAQLDDCIRKCLNENSHDKYQWLLDSSRSRTRSLTRASVLEDYSYDGIICGGNSRRVVLLDDCPSVCERKLSPNDLSLKEIREVNDALARQGISVFTPDNHHHHHPHHAHHPHHHQNHHHHHHEDKPHNVGEILSACRLLMNDPTLAVYHQHAQPMKNVWDHIHNYPGGIDQHQQQQQNLQFGRPGSPNPSVYSTPQYMPGPPPMINASSYMPGPPPPQPPPMSTPGSPNAARNVLASLFSGRPN